MCFFCVLKPAGSILVLAHIPRAPKKVPWAHFGGGEPLSSSFFGTENLDADQEIPSNVTSSSAKCSYMLRKNSQVDVFSRIAALTLEVQHLAFSDPKAAFEWFWCVFCLCSNPFSILVCWLRVCAS